MYMSIILREKYRFSLLLKYFKLSNCSKMCTHQMCKSVHVHVHIWMFVDKINMYRYMYMTLYTVLRVSNPNVLYYTEGQIPKGAQYIGKKESVEGNVKHTDTFYYVPREERSPAKSPMSPTAPSPSPAAEPRGDGDKSTSPVRYMGIGPLDAQGMPIMPRPVCYSSYSHVYVPYNITMVKLDC